MYVCLQMREHRNSWPNAANEAGQVLVVSCASIHLDIVAYYKNNNNSNSNSALTPTCVYHILTTE